jgi:hypothetical protein
MMNFADKMRRWFVVPTHMFVTGEIVLGFLCFLLLKNFIVPSPSEWVILYAFIGTVLMLNFFPIALPPEGNGISMETSVFLSCIFIFGIDTSLTVLLLSSILFAIYKRDIALWKYCFNFSSYSLSITGAYYSFIATGGVIGSLDTQHLYPYLLALSIYFFINVMSWYLLFFSDTRKFISCSSRYSQGNNSSLYKHLAVFISPVHLTEGTFLFRPIFISKHLRFIIHRLQAVVWFISNSRGQSNT